MTNIIPQFLPVWITFLFTGTGNKKSVCGLKSGGIQQDMTSVALSCTGSVRPHNVASSSSPQIILYVRKFPTEYVNTPTFFLQDRTDTDTKPTSLS